MERAEGHDSKAILGSRGNGELLDLHADEDARAAESDNEVPPDLLMDPQSHISPALSREDSENEVPPEFLAQHHGDDDDVE
jgi:hypothetical protein